MFARKTRSVALAVLALLFVARSAAAAQVTLAWDANIETDLAGYIVEWGTTASPYSNSIDVGNTTTWTLATAVEGTTYSFRVIAYNTAGLKSNPSASVSETVPVPAPAPPPPPPSPVTFSVDRAYLNFGVTRNGTTVSRQTRAQTVTITEQGTGTLTWTVSASAPWVQVAPTSGSGNGSFTVSLNIAATPLSGNADATVTIASPQASNSPLTVQVHLKQKLTGSSTAPTGAFDTPVNGTTNVVGAIAVTGWAVDDVEVSKVEIWRDPVGSEPVAGNGKVLIGNAVFVAGARPDVEGLTTDMPLNYRAGWGYLLLTNGLPDGATATGGNGVFTLYAYATDVEGHQTLLGSKQITVANATSIKPFGTLDTPGQGETVSGAAYVSFGWALSPRSTIPRDGSTIDVYIDGVNQGHPTYNNYRSDIASAFPAYANSSGAVGYLVLDTTKLGNGVHTIGWLARDAAGNAEGLGSRFFTVLNSSTAAVVAAPLSVEAAQAVQDAPVANQLIDVRRPAAEQAADIAIPEYSGRAIVRASELEQVELHLATFTTAVSGTYEGYLAVGGELRPLPAGSTLDAAQGLFTWQPGAGYVGVYDFVFVRTDAAGNKTRIPVRLEIQSGRGTAGR